MSSIEMNPMICASGFYFNFAAGGISNKASLLADNEINLFSGRCLMINRIRVVTLLVMVLGVFALLQLISGSLFFFPSP